MDHAGDTEIELDINERNFSNIEDKCKLLHDIPVKEQRGNVQ